MPWSLRDRPSAAIGALAAFVRRERPDYAVRCRSEFLAVAQRVGTTVYDALSCDAYGVGEILYTALLYPDRAEQVRSFIANKVARASATGVRGLGGDVVELGSLFDRLLAQLHDHLERLADDLVETTDVVGLTTSFGQLFGNLALAQAIKRRRPEVQTCLGGATVSGRVGPSLLAEFPFVDFVIQGEGELPLLARLDAIVGRPSDPPAAGAVATPRGILDREAAATHPNGVPLWEVTRLDDLPLPDHDEFAGLAEEHGIDWHLSIEGSRGCWWDRTRRTGDSRDTCYFCNLNIQWGGYREKSAGRVAQELEVLSDRHKVLKVMFLDNIIRSRGVEDLATRIHALGRDFTIFYEARASIRPRELCAMSEAGLTGVQFGIEGLSTAYLRRIGKGTTMIQNLQAMRLCGELGIENSANLIVDFPGSTAQEVEETRRTILEYALSFAPLNAVRFCLGVDNTLDSRRDEFGIVNVRNADSYRVGLPDDVWRRLKLFDLSFDVTTPCASWDPVRDAVATWSKLHADRRGVRLLRYRDGASFLRIEDERFGELRTLTVDGFERELYLYCMDHRSRAQIGRRFVDAADPDVIDSALEQFVEHRLMVRENDRFLSLAMATTPQLAARRIRETVDETPEPVAAQSRPAGTRSRSLALLDRG